MDSFKLWIFSVCGATAVTAVFKLLLSNSTLKKALNIFFSLFILFYTVIPMENFLGGSFEMSSDESDVRYEEFYQEGYELLIKEAIGNTCKNLSVTVLSVDIDSYIDDEGSLNIRSLAITTDSPERKTEIEETLKKELGFEVSVS